MIHYPDRFRVISWLALAGLLLGALSGCQPLLPQAEPVTITFAFPDIDRKYYEALLVQFKELYPYITVEFKPYQWFRGRRDEKSDVWVASSWNNFSQGNLDFAQMLNLDALVAQDQGFAPEEFYPGTLDAFRQDGQLMAVPYGLDPWVMYYNPQLFQQYNVSPPAIDWTWEDFLQKAQKLTDPKAGIYGYAASEDYPDSFFFLFQHGGRLVDGSGNPVLNDPLNIEAMEWYAGLYHVYKVAPTFKEAQDAFGYGGNPTMRGVISNRVGMWTGSLTYRWALQEYVEGARFNWGVAPLPRDAVPFGGAFFEGYAISKDTQSPDACWKWIAYLSRQIPERLMPARRSLVESTAYEQRVGQAVAAATRAAMQNAVLASPQMVDQLGNAFEPFMAAVKQIIDEDVPVREALENAQRQAEGR